MKGERVAVDELAAPERHIFLSPHYDDIALSVGGTAALLTRAGRRPEVALIFGEHPDPTVPLTAFAESMHRGWGLDPRQVIASRRGEEAAAGALLGTTTSFLPFRDAIYRGDRYLSDEDLFGSPVGDESSLPDEIIDTIGLGLADQAMTRVYAPLGVGQHVDHQHVFAVGVALGRQGWDVWFYEDLPYALRSGACEDRLATAGVPLTEGAVVEVSETWEVKIAAILAYPSQLATVFAYVDCGSSREEIEGVMRAYATAAGGGSPAERFWRLVGV